MSMESFMQYLDLGGNFVIWGLVFCSVLVLAVALERLYFFLKASRNNEKLLNHISSLIFKNAIPEAVQFCEKEAGLLASVLKAGLHRAHLNREAIQEAMNIQTANASRLLEANLSILGTMAVIAPFIGLLGTVLGIIQAFNDIAKHGKTGIETVGAGVAEALVTTAAGLFVAIFAVTVFNYFKTKIKWTTGEIFNSSTRLAEMLYCKQTDTPLPP